ncbi:MAG: hypothetical protein JETT_1904 [Candidatus Jettenia ecosi]|uniref:Uncharacterized protein n=1 Tax=Candidatus Jettenia ecosi TaxID=2494326 RepID=A0A533QAS9_9BACT|nr:MAG: hypothetical protein JETT_1904 [Candidatus Jettenia ecosi]
MRLYVRCKILRLYRGIKSPLLGGALEVGKKENSLSFVF